MGARHGLEYNVGVIVHGNSFIHNELCRAVKYKYCPECGKAYLKSRLEKDKCIYCGKPCQVVDVKRNRQYYLGYGVIVLGAVVILVIRFWFYNMILLWTVGIITILAGGMLVMVGSNKMARKAAETVGSNKMAREAAETVGSNRMAREAAERTGGHEDETNETGGEPDGEGAEKIINKNG